MVEHNLAPKEIRFLTLVRICEAKVLFRKHAEIAQLVEHNLAKVRVASSSLVFRSRKTTIWLSVLFYITHTAVNRIYITGFTTYLGSPAKVGD